MGDSSANTENNFVGVKRERTKRLYLWGVREGICIIQYMEKRRLSQRLCGFLLVKERVPWLFVSMLKARILNGYAMTVSGQNMSMLESMSMAFETKLDK